MNTQLTKINRSQHIDILSSPSHQGRYFYEITDQDVGTPWVGIDKTKGGDYNQHAFATELELMAWFEQDTLGEGEKRRRGERETAPSDDPFRPAVIEDDPFRPVELATENAEVRQSQISNLKSETVTIVATDAIHEEVMSIEDVISKLKAAETEYIERYRTEANYEGQLKERQQRFNEENAALIGLKKEASEAVATTEAEVKTLLVAFAKLTGEKKFDEYLSVKEFTEWEIDEAAATTWAETNYPAAINKVTNFKLLTDYVKTAKEKFSWATSRTVTKPQISKKF